MKRRFYIILSILALAANTFAAGTDIAGGRISKTTGGYEANYFITDHLGSVRVTVSENGEIKEQNNYYPFGKRWETADMAITNNRYRFNGKEEQTAGKTNWLDYGARMYDDFLGRWFTHDPKSYRRPWESPYGYCGGNPVLRVDPKSSNYLVPLWLRYSNNNYSIKNGKIQISAA
jgi:RHS repeat-associated protein